MKNYVPNKALIIIISVMFIGATIIPTISGNYNKKDTLSLTFYTFDKTGTKKCKVELSTDVVNIISDMFEELKYKITYNSNNDEIKSLKNDFVEILDINGLIPQGLSKDYMNSLLNPKWLQYTRHDNHYSKDRSNILPMQSSNMGTAVICSMTGGGKGLIFTPIMFPRPRLLTIWSSYSTAVSTAANLITGRGFIATGRQTGIALGFWGIGLSFAFPGEPATFGFGGYAMLTLVKADEIETYPPNQVPVISEENPSDHKWDIPVSLSELSFRISDPDGDRMSYTVTTEPDIGSGEAHQKNNGVYKIPISGLEYDKSYSWTVRVSDNKDTTEKQFSFFTEMGPPFNPFDQGWSYRKKITIDHSKVAGYLSDFPVLVSLVDSDLAAKSQDDGDDIMFMDGSGVASRLFHEIEFFNGSSGELVAWVSVDELSDSSDTDFYMYYGNLDCISQQYPEKVWDLNYKAVWHLSESGTGLRYDSTCNHKNGTPYNYEGDEAVLGQIDGADDFDGNSDEIKVNDDSSLNFKDTNQFSISTWINRNDLSFTNSRSIISKGTSSNNCGYNIAIGVDKRISFRIADGYSSYQCRSNIIINTGIWYNIVTNWDGNTLYLYINGMLENSTYLGDVVIADDTKSLQIGNHWWDHWFPGIIDEIRVSDISRSSDWVSTEFNNQNDPSDFYSVSPEESAP